MKVWVVEKGEYSDRRVMSVCSSKDIAERTGEFFDPNKYETTISEFEIDQEKSWSDAGLSPFRVYISPKETSVQVTTFSFLLGLNEVSLTHPNGSVEYGSAHVVEVLARDKDHAVKIAADLVRAFKAVKS